MSHTVLPLDRNLPHLDRSVGAGPFRHCIRTSWGLALCVARRGRFAHYLFEDGERRRIATSHEHLMEPADLSPQDEATAMAKLRALSGLDEATASTDEGARFPTLEQQCMVFRHEYPKGFVGNRWRSERRGDGALRRLKRHRDAAIEMAQERLSEDRLRALLHAGNEEAVIRSTVQVLRSTTLVSKRRLAPLRKLPYHRHRAVAEALFDLLYGGSAADDEYLPRFDRFVGSLRGPRRTIHWSLATAVPALVYPEHHVCVRPKRVRKQARSLLPELSLPKAADIYAYRHVRAMHERLLEELRGRDLAPQDMLDVHDFMKATLKPSAIALLRELDPDAFPEEKEEELAGADTLVPADEGEPSRDAA